MFSKNSCLVVAVVMFLASCTTVKKYEKSYARNGAKLIVFRVDPLFTSNFRLPRWLGDQPVINIDGANVFKLLKNEFVTFNTDAGRHQVGVSGDIWGPYQFKSIETTKHETVYVQVSLNKDLEAAVARNGILRLKPVKYLCGIPTYQLEVVSKQEFERLSGRLREYSGDE
jgi:hypothetical protein